MSARAYEAGLAGLSTLALKQLTSCSSKTKRRLKDERKSIRGRSSRVSQIL